MNKEILDLIIQIERSDFKDRLGHKLRDNKAYISLVNKFKDSIDNKAVKPTHIEWLTPIEQYPRYDRCTIAIPDIVKPIPQDMGINESDMLRRDRLLMIWHKMNYKGKEKLFSIEVKEDSLVMKFVKEANSKTYIHSMGLYKEALDVLNENSLTDKEIAGKIEEFLGWIPD